MFEYGANNSRKTGWKQWEIYRLDGRSGVAWQRRIDPGPAIRSEMSDTG